MGNFRNFRKALLENSETSKEDISGGGLETFRKVLLININRRR